MDAPDPAATIAKRLSQLNKEASLRTLAAQNLQRKRKLSEILGQAFTHAGFEPLCLMFSPGSIAQRPTRAEEDFEGLRVSGTGCSLPWAHASTAHRLGESSAGQHVREQLPLHLAAPHPRPPAGPAVPPAGRGAAAALDHVNCVHAQPAHCWTRLDTTVSPQRSQSLFKAPPLINVSV
ncbi:uncharacterized protein LOC142991150 isoform X2 [Genypterus blacodes]|uniref:uncharacterized protein LOC142991150 isoform X2 n=1 Tax=Genypterus blacodes TaxID=154954 RepID=UPI003F7642A2